MTNNHNYLGYWIRRFLMEYLILDKNYSVNTQKSYRDTFRLLLPFIANRLHKTVENILVDDVDSSLILSFLNTIENERKCSISTRNQRLAAVASLARYIGCHCPEYVIWCQSVRNIPIKRSPKNLKKRDNWLWDSSNKRKRRKDKTLSTMVHYLQKTPRTHKRKEF